MAQEAQDPKELKNIGYEVFIGALSILSIVNMALRALFRDEAMQTVVGAMNAVFMPIFLGDFAIASLPPSPSPTISSGSSVGPTCSPACPSRT